MSSAGMPTVRLQPPLTRWEYHLVTLAIGGFLTPDVDLNTLGDRLNGLGEHGWELVAVTNITQANGQSVELVAIMKRPVV